MDFTKWEESRALFMQTCKVSLLALWGLLAERRGQQLKVKTAHLPRGKQHNKLILSP